MKHPFDNPAAEAAFVLSVAEYLNRPSNFADDEDREIMMRMAFVAGQRYEIAERKAELERQIKT